MLFAFCRKCWMVLVLHAGAFQGVSQDNTLALERHGWFASSIPQLSQGSLPSLSSWSHLLWFLCHPDTRPFNNNRAISSSTFLTLYRISQIPLASSSLVEVPISRTTMRTRFQDMTGTIQLFTSLHRLFICMSARPKSLVKGTYLMSSYSMCLSKVS